MKTKQVKPVTKYKVLVNTYDCKEGEWTGNAMRFDTEKKAEEWGRGLYQRWTNMRRFKVVKA